MRVLLVTGKFAKHWCIALFLGLFLEIKHLCAPTLLYPARPTLHRTCVSRTLLLIWVLAHSNLFSRINAYYYFLRTLFLFLITSPHSPSRTHSRHHCRLCGQVVCGSCSGRRHPKYQETRICRPCYSMIMVSKRKKLQV